MPLDIVPEGSFHSRPVFLVPKDRLAEVGLVPPQRVWAQANNFTGEAGKVVLLPAEDGTIAGALFGLGDDNRDCLAVGILAKALPEGDWHLHGNLSDPNLSLLGLMLGGYAFTLYGKKSGPRLRFAVPSGADVQYVGTLADATFLVRDLINTPANDMGPDALENAVRLVGETHAAEVEVIAGDDLLARNFPMIHAVGRAAAQAPRLIDLTWGHADAPKVTLVGKGVCFDTGGLDIKPSAGMLLMKKDMGGAANVLGLASMIMAQRLPVRLRVLIPAVENSISGNAFRPGDILTSRKGKTVEIGNTDAEGRLVLADALALADEEAPRLLIDMATLTGAARVALGPDLPPFYCDDEAFAAELQAAAAAVEDPVWRMPLWRPYEAKLASKLADLNNVTPDSFAGSITAALFLRAFVEKADCWAHFDIFGWSPSDRPQGPAGGEAQAIRALEHLISRRFPRD